MNNRYQLLFRAEGSPGPLRQQLYGGEERVDVRDMATRATIRIPARDLSLYRHTLLLEGRSYQILNVVRQ
jgi:hypothetical protein